MGINILFQVFYFIFLSLCPVGGVFQSGSYLQGRHIDSLIKCPEYRGGYGAHTEFECRWGGGGVGHVS